MLPLFRIMTLCLKQYNLKETIIEETKNKISMSIHKTKMKVIMKDRN